MGRDTDPFGKPWLGPVFLLGIEGLPCAAFAVARRELLQVVVAGAVVGGGSAGAVGCARLYGAAFLSLEISNIAHAHAAHWADACFVVQVIADLFHDPFSPSDT